MVSRNGKCAPQDLVWGDVSALLAIARSGTLSAAACELGVGIATLSRRVDRLEKALRVPLFLRQQTGYKLTKDGANLMVSAEAMEAAAFALMSEFDSKTHLSGTVRLATAENLATGLIIPHLPRFTEQYPKITVELITNISAVSVHRHDADLAIRMVKPQRGNVSFRRLGSMGYGLYGSIDYIAKRSMGSSPSSYENDALIAWSETFGHLPAAQWVYSVLQGRPPALVTTSLATQITAALEGIGLAVLPHFLTKSTNLVCVDSEIGVHQPVYLVIQSDLAQSRRTRALADFLSDLIISHTDDLLRK